MNKVQEAYIKGVAHTLETYALQMLQCAQALQRNSLQDMPIELLPVNLKDISEPCIHIQGVLNEIIVNIPQEDNTWNVYLEEADTDEPKRLIGTVDAYTQSKALELAAEYYEHPSHDLVVKLKSLDKE